MTCECKTGPGKFEGEPALAYLVWHAASHGDVDISTYHGETVIDWFVRPFGFDADEDTVKSAREYGYCDACIGEAIVDDSYGLSLRQTGDGFVHLVCYPTKREYEDALEEAERDEDPNAW